MADEDAWLAPLQTGQAKLIAPVPAADFAGDLASAIWLPSGDVAQAWTQYMIDTSVADTTSPPAPSNLQLRDGELTWESTADLESGLSHFIIQRDGKVLATVPEDAKKPFGRPVFQGLQYSDTPAVPLARMRYTVDRAEPDEVSRYRVIAVNTVGLQSV